MGIDKSQRSHMGDSLEVFGEKRRIGKIQVFGDLSHREVGVQQLRLGIIDEGTVYPLLRRDAAGLPDDRTEIAFGEAHTVGIVV